MSTKEFDTSRFVPTQAELDEFARKNEELKNRPPSYRASTFTIEMARAGHPVAMRVMDNNWPGWREHFGLHTGYWNADYTVFTPVPAVFHDPEDPAAKAPKATRA